jgi:hypothetical protein
MSNNKKVLIILALFLFNFCFALTGTKYLIFTPDSFASALQPLADWKTKKGVKTKIVPLSVTGNTPSQIKTYIANAYNTWQIKPQYILLAGLGTILPVNGTSDDYYADMIGNYQIELSVGRLPFTSLDQCNMLVAKILGYERTPYMQDSLWFRKGTTIIKEDAPPDHFYQADCRYIRSLMQASNFVLAESICDLYGQNSATVMNSINNGRSYVVYRGQGVSQWYPPFNSIEPNNLNNGFKLPVIISGTCATMYLNDSGAYSDRFMRAGSAQNPKGAVAYFGTTNVGSSVSLYRGVVAKGFFQSVFAEGTFILGDATKRAKFILDSLYNNQTRYAEWNLYGDPEMNLWTATPNRISVTYDSIIGNVPQIYQVTVCTNSFPCANASVCLMMDTLIYQTAYTNTFGIATLVISPPNVGTMSITVTGKNLLPYEGTVRIRPQYPAHDVGITNYIQPQGIINSGTNIIPEVKVKNYAVNTDTFAVSFNIGSVYYQTLNSIVLGPDDTVTLSFPNWTAVGGNHAITVYTILNSDQYHINDTVHSNVMVIVPNDVGVDSILLPLTSHIINMVMTPKVRIKNYGSANQNNFPVVCSIIGTGHVTRYTNTQNISSLNVGDTLTISFSSWTPAIAETLTVIVRTGLATDSISVNDRKVRSTTIVLMYLEDFETNNGNYIADPSVGAWAWGIPTAGPAGAYSGQKCWGTGLIIPYSNNANWKLDSRQFVATINSPQLRFMHWYECESGWDGGNVKYSTNGTTWILLSPALYPYNGIANTGNAGIPGESCYTGTGGTSWQQAGFTIPVNSGQAFWIRWHFGSDGSVTYAGWYIDDVTGSGYLPLGVVDENHAMYTMTSTVLYAKPNPITNGFTRISFLISTPTRASLRIYDASGRIVRILVNTKLNRGIYNYIWNGIDDNDHKVAEGIYFYTLTTENTSSSRKLVYIR